MKKLITIILSLIMTIFTAPNQSANQTHVAAVNPPQTEITITVEQVPEESKKPAETAFVSEVTGQKQRSKCQMKKRPQFRKR